MKIQPEKLLIIEDSSADAKLISHVLDDLHFSGSIQIIHSGKKALHALFSESSSSFRHLLPKAIIMDLGLADIHGVELLLKLKAHPMTRQIPIIIYTGCESKQNRQICRDAGVICYTQKVCDLRELERLLKKFIQFWNRLSGNATSEARGSCT